MDSDEKKACERKRERERVVERRGEEKEPVHSRPSRGEQRGGGSSERDGGETAKKRGTRKEETTESGDPASASCTRACLTKTQ